ncbi:hypothetical protein [Devosia sp. SL43]|uniref:hypothetical protein n=1 Tax=Devosia sp. SL43 TaxID=2806348 RepID=UPI001F2DEFBF|nr:hypothetical protein [Devosia sp. SL43]UJW85741.1 hypothetical protein IM737_00070 [Devosia sp. SL43]
MRQIILASAFALATIGMAAAQDVGGSYAVDGTNINGSPYSGTAEITLLSETTCAIEWTTGPTTSTGICMRNGNAFSAGYVLGDAIGLLIYEILEDGSMEGIWTVAGQDGTGTETLTPQ